MRKQLINYLKSGHSGIYIISHEEQRVEAEVAAAAMDSGFALLTWSCTEGLRNMEGEVVGPTGPTGPATVEPVTMLKTAMDDKVKQKTVVLARDLHMLMKKRDPVLTRKLKDFLIHGHCTNKVIIVVGCQLELCPELEKMMKVIELKLPDKEQLNHVLERIAESGGVKLNGNRDKILEASAGLTTVEAEDTFALSVAEKDEDIVYREKANTIKKNGILELVENKVTLEDIGGLENLKRDLFEKRNLFSKAAREYGLPTPRPLLTVGQAGTGKSLTATACGSVFGVPLLRLEAGRLFGSLVGQSEENWRRAFETAKAIVPCVAWVDEIDGLFSGGQSSAKTDGGTTNRVIKAILQDLQFNSDGIFFVFTANDIDGLPDPLIDRCDVWSVDLPTQSEREAIIKIHIAKRKRDPKSFSVPMIAKMLDGFSGRQIEQVWLKAMTIAFNDSSREPDNDDFANAANEFVPTSVTMKDQIEARRARLHGKAKPASVPEGQDKTSSSRKLSK
jgi:AAA+ superfamily predicted ATPase